MTDRPRPSWTRVAALGCAIGLALAGARAGVLIGMDHFVRGHALDAVLLRVAARLPMTLTLAFAVGLGVAVLAHLRARALPIVVATALAFALLAGWPYDDSFHVPDPSTSQGRGGLAALAGAALIGVLASRGLARWCGCCLGARTALVLALVGLATPMVFERVWLADDEMRITRVHRDLTEEAATWEVVQADGSAPPSAGVMTTTLDYKVDGGDRPSILLPPPAAIRVRTDATDPTLWLRAATGAGRDAGRREPVAVRYEVRINGELKHESERRFAREDAASDRTWIEVGGDDGLEVPPGSEVELRVLPLDGSIWPKKHPVGFGGVRLERRTTRPRARASADSPSIVLLVMDTLRADRTSLHGYARETTPALEALAARGTTFDAAYSSSSWTWPSTASILTGLAPHEHGVRSSRACFLAHELETLPERLQERGYTTAAFTANPLIVPDKNFDQGFESFSFSRATFLASSVLVPDALDWLERNAGRRFFLYLHLVDPHEPHRPFDDLEAAFTSGRPSDLPEGAFTKYGMELLAKPEAARDSILPPAHARWFDEVYDACVASGDRRLREVLDKLGELKLTDSTIVAFTSDHGEELMKHGQLKHGQALWEELVHVPLVVAGPGVAEGVRVATPVANREIARALAHRAGAAFAGRAPRIDFARPEALEARPIVTSTESGWLGGERDQSIVGVRDGRWNVHFQPAEEGGEARILGAFDLEADPDQMHTLWAADMSAEERGRFPLDRLLRIARERIDEWTRRSPKVREAGESTLGVLRGVGYLGGEEE